MPEMNETDDKLAQITDSVATADTYSLRQLQRFLNGAKDAMDEARGSWSLEDTGIYQNIKILLESCPKRIDFSKKVDLFVQDYPKCHRVNFWEKAKRMEDLRKAYLECDAGGARAFVRRLKERAGIPKSTTNELIKILTIPSEVVPKISDDPLSYDLQSLKEVARCKDGVAAQVAMLPRLRQELAKRKLDKVRKSRATRAANRAARARQESLELPSVEPREGTTDDTGGDLHLGGMPPFNEAQLKYLDERFAAMQVKLDEGTDQKLAKYHRTRQQAGAGNVPEALPPTTTPPVPVPLPPPRYYTLAEANQHLNEKAMRGILPPSSNGLYADDFPMMLEVLRWLGLFPFKDVLLGKGTSMTEAAFLQDVVVRYHNIGWSFYQAAKKNLPDGLALVEAVTKTRRAFDQAGAIREGLQGRRQ